MLLAPSVSAQEEGQDRPNILVIMPDDVGMWNISAHSMGMTGYQTPNIERNVHHANGGAEEFRRNPWGTFGGLSAQSPETVRS